MCNYFPVLWTTNSSLVVSQKNSSHSPHRAGLGKKEDWSIGRS
jgi:hypothetical protein